MNKLVVILIALTIVNISSADWGEGGWRGIFSLRHYFQTKLIKKYSLKNRRRLGWLERQVLKSLNPLKTYKEIF